MQSPDASTGAWWTEELLWEGAPDASPDPFADEIDAMAQGAPDASPGPFADEIDAMAPPPPVPPIDCTMGELAQPMGEMTAECDQLVEPYWEGGAAIPRAWYRADGAPNAEREQYCHCVQQISHGTAMRLACLLIGEGGATVGSEYTSCFAALPPPPVE